ncbi:hypothetical protein BH24CHL6_BH24CHL6_00630 [soil metagenome]
MPWNTKRARRVSEIMRAGPIMAAVLLLAACAGAPSPSPSPSPAGEPVHILATDLWDSLAGPFSVAAASAQEEYDELWQRVGLQIPQPEADLERYVVLFLGMAGSSSCPERFERLVVDDTLRVYAEWSQRPGDQPCTDDLAAQGLLIAVRRSELPSEPFAFSLRQQPTCPDCPDQPDQLVVDPR